jgi:hypothetical protein
VLSSSLNFRFFSSLFALDGSVQLSPMRLLIENFEHLFELIFAVVEIEGGDAN